MAFKKCEPAITVAEQINNLHNLGLVISDKDFAEDFLNKVSYYRLIKAYSLSLKPKNRKYFENTTFEQITELYHFNTKLRHLLMMQIEDLEISLRCQIGNYFSLKYGNWGYLDLDNFVDKENYDSYIDRVFDEIDRNNNSPIVKNFKIGHEIDEPPFFAAVELFSFGTLSKMFKNMKNKDKLNISLLYGQKNIRLFESWIEHIAYVRNICAHYGRIYNLVFSIKPELKTKYVKFGVKNSHVFATLLCLKELSHNFNEWNNYVDMISKLIDNSKYVELELLGFPQNWEQLLKHEIKVLTGTIQ